MGCSCSKLGGEDDCDDHEGNLHDCAEAVARCKQRKELLKRASQARASFARANAEYLKALEKTGAALQEFCRGELQIFVGDVSRSDEVQEDDSHTRRFAVEYTPMASQRVVIPPPSYVEKDTDSEQYVDGVAFKPPPPPPGCSSNYLDTDFLIHAAREPPVKCKEIQDDDDELNMVVEFEGDEVKVIDKCVHKNQQPQAAPQNISSMPEQNIPSSLQSDASSELDSDNDKLAIVKVEFSAPEIDEIFRYVFQEFLRASHSGASVASMLESNEGTELGLLGASIEPVTWRNTAAEDDKKSWSQALTLERLSAWELKLYEEVKALNAINIDFNKKRKLLCKYDVNRVHDETVDKTRADIKAIETQMLVAVQATEATAAAIQKITNDEMHFQLVELVHGLADMWKEMEDCHEHQRNAVFDLKIPRNVPVSGASKKSTAHTLRLALATWQYSLGLAINAEKEYVKSIREWLKSNITSLNRTHHLTRRQERIIKMVTPEIYYLCEEWEKSLGEVRNLNACKTMQEFSVMLYQVEIQEMEENKVRKRLETLVKELDKKMLAINNMEKKLLDGKKANLAVTISEKRASMDILKQKVEQEKEKLEKMVKARRLVAASCIENGLPKLFGEACEFAKQCVQAHKELHTRAKHGIKHSVIN